MSYLLTACKAALLAGIFLLTIQGSHLPANYTDQSKADDEYVCIPCGNDCDNTVYHSPGKCPNCNMLLVKKSTVHITNIQPTEICNYIASHPGVVLLDVRTKEEFEEKANPDFGTLKGAINIPVQVLESKLST